MQPSSYFTLGQGFAVEMFAPHSLLSLVFFKVLIYALENYMLIVYLIYVSTVPLELNSRKLLVRTQHVGQYLKLNVMMIVIECCRLHYWQLQVSMHSRSLAMQAMQSVGLKPFGQI